MTVSLLAYLFPRHPNYLIKGYRNQLDWQGIDDSGASNATTEDTSLTTGSDVESTACRALIWPRRPHLESSLLGLQQVWRRTAKPCFHCMILGRVYAPACQQFHDILIYIIYIYHMIYIYNYIYIYNDNIYILTLVIQIMIVIIIY